MHILKKKRYHTIFRASHRRCTISNYAHCIDSHIFCFRRLHSNASMKSDPFDWPYIE